MAGIPHDIRMNVPQYNPKVFENFPRVHKKPYPRMMTHEVGGKLVPYKRADGRPVIVEDAEAERAFHAKVKGEQPKAPEAVTVSVAEPVQTQEAVQEVVAHEQSAEAPRVKRKYTRRTLEP